jgi:hypothetical protein
VLPPLLGATSDIIEKATITQSGRLTPHFSYLENYAAL